MMNCRAIAIGGSAGSLGIVFNLVEILPAGFRIPILLCLHLHPDDNGKTAEHLGARAQIQVAEAIDKMPVVPGRLHTAPAGYHLLVEKTGTLALSTDRKIHFSQPSIDVLFESAARAYDSSLVAILLSGANRDGADGMKIVRDQGGTTIAQDPATAESPLMPSSAIENGSAMMILSPEQIFKYIMGFHTGAGK